MTGEAVKAMRAAPQTDRRRDRRRLRRRRRDPRDGVGSADRHREGQDRLPVQPRRACRLRHGRLRDPAAHHRAGPRRRAALYRPRHGRRGSRALAASSTGCRRRRPCWRMRTRSPTSLAPDPTFANAMTKRMLEMEWAMSVEQAIEAEAVAQALCMETEDFKRAYPRLRGEAEAGLRGQLRCRSPKPLTWPFFDDGHRDFAERLSRWAADNLHKLPHDDVDEACRARVKALGEAGFLAPTVPAIYGGSHPQLDVRTLCLAREILGYHDGLADFAFAMQGLGTGSISLYGTPELKRPLSAQCREGQEHRGLRHFRTRSRLGCRGAEDDGGAGRQRACPPERQQDLDFEWRHRRSLRRVRPHRRGAGRARPVGLHGRCRHAGPERAASASR